MLISALAIALMEEKIQKKQAEEEAKGARKKEREEKKCIREEEPKKESTGEAMKSRGKATQGYTVKTVVCYAHQTSSTP